MACLTAPRFAPALCASPAAADMTSQRDRVEEPFLTRELIFLFHFAGKFEGREGSGGVEEPQIRAPPHPCWVARAHSSPSPATLPTIMGIFGSKKVVWVPQNEELKEKCENVESWAAKERSGAAQPPRERASPHTCLCVPHVPASACRMRPACMLTGRPVRRRHGSFVGWKVQNDGKLLMNAIGKCESCSNLDLSYNGLGDNEAEALGKALKRNYSGNDKPYAGVAGARMYGTIVKV